MCFVSKVKTPKQRKILKTFKDIKLIFYLFCIVSTIQNFILEVFGNEINEDINTV